MNENSIIDLIIDQIYLIIILIVALPAILLALWRDKKLHEQNPNATGFVWGYFNGFGLFLFAIVLLLLLVFTMLSGEIPAGEALGFSFFVIVFCLVPGIFILRRHRWAWIFYTVCSVNPVLWIINGVYIKNRWNELKEESAASSRPVPTPAPRSLIPTTSVAPADPPQPSSHSSGQTTPAQKKRSMHGCLLASLIALALLVVGLPLGLYIAGRAFMNYAKKTVEKSPLYLAVAVGDIQEVDRLLGKGANPDEKALMGHSPLIMATRSDYALIAEHLLKAGADPNQKDNLGWAPLHHAIKTDNASLDMITILVHNGANVAVTDNHLRTPLHRAAQFGHVQAVQLLLRLGANPNAQDKNGWTPLDRGRAHPAIVRVLEANN